MVRMSSILFGGCPVPKVEQADGVIVMSSFWGVVQYFS